MENEKKSNKILKLLLEAFYILSPAAIEVGVFELLLIWIKEPSKWFIAYLLCMTVSVLYTLLVIRKHTYEDKTNKLTIGIALAIYYALFIGIATPICQLVFINKYGMSGRVLELILLAINLVIENLYHHIILAKLGKDNNERKEASVN